MPTIHQALSRLERLYVTLESPTAYGTAVVPTSASYCRHIKLTMNNTRALLNRRDKTGMRSKLKGGKGRASAKWSFESSLVAGNVPPDCDVMLQMLFGQASVAGAYALSDTVVSGNLWSYRQPATINQRVALGSVLQNFQFNLGQDIAEWTCDGEALYVLGSNFMTAADLTQKGGITAFGVEPTGPVSHGDIIAGFTGAITVATQTLATIRTATIKGATGNSLIKDTFGSYYPTSTIGDERNIGFAFSMYEDDSAGFEALKEAADSKTPVTATVQVGTLAGNIYTFTLNGLQLDSEALDDNTARYSATFGDSPTHASAIGVIDDFSLAIT